VTPAVNTCAQKLIKDTKTAIVGSPVVTVVIIAVLQEDSKIEMLSEILKVTDMKA